MNIIALETFATSPSTIKYVKEADAPNPEISDEVILAHMDKISKTIQATQNAVNNINEKVEGISSIATQTNLLSLNASIEAARAGETGASMEELSATVTNLAESASSLSDIAVELNEEMKFFK